MLTQPQTRRFNQRIPAKNKASAAETDPHAANFLRQQLGPEKWNTFSARLFEQRLGTNKLKPRSRIKCHEPETKGGASTIDFLVKVEVVKEILRTYVPYVFLICMKICTDQHCSTQTSLQSAESSVASILGRTGWSSHFNTLLSPCSIWLVEHSILLLGTTCRRSLCPFRIRRTSAICSHSP